MNQLARLVALIGLIAAGASARLAWRHRGAPFEHLPRGPAAAARRFPANDFVDTEPSVHGGKAVNDPSALQPDRVRRFA